MAYPSLAVGGTPTVMQSRLQQDQLTQLLFSFYFSRFAIGDQATGWCSQGCQAIVDMGTFLLAVSQQYMTSFLQSTGAQQNENGDNNNYCMLGIEASYLPSSSGEPLWILGNVFLKEYYSVFDVANNHVGFALSTLTSARQLPAAACNLPKDSAIALMPLWLRAAF
ncbi:hypothetical protein J1605_008051 [Eschrichtius robustus]|uniref:Peptidase A1 domain-containing protein n=1 Tax=Eschrichtius robustus TaxID=9764 RepID=A0AB34H1D8_ESCRO|nr:hypothetical protein J1605_008051 [Eschrichtius robustus]